MFSIPHRLGKCESAVSICLLTVILLIGIGIFIKQFDYDMSRFGINTAVIELSTQQLVAAGEEKPALASWKPQGFSTLSDIEVYNPENLYEKINGKAPLYIDSGFVKLFTQRFKSDKDKDENLWMEIFVFDMATIRNAFSVYSVQQRADSDILPDMQFGYKTTNSLYFVHGKFYIELLGSSESAELLQAMEQTTDNIISKLTIGKTEKIDELALFPQENLVPGSSKLYLTSAFGCEKLTDIFTARYKVGNETITAFISKKADSKEAEATAESYRKFLIENGAVIKNTTKKILVGKVIDSYGTTEIVFTAGPFVGGVHEAEDQQSAEKIAEILYKALNSLNNE